MSVGSLSPTALIFRAPHRSGDPVVDARSFLCRNGHGLRPPSGRCRCERASPSNSPSPACFSCLCPKTGHRLFFCFDHPRTEERSQKARPLRPCSDTAGCRACGTLCVHGYAAFPWSDRPQPLHPPQAPATMLSRLPARSRQRTTTAPLPEDGTAIRNRINVLGREELTGWWPQDRGRQERRCSGKRNEMLQKGPSPHLPPARKRHEFF